jgi:hypothetical protein
VQTTRRGYTLMEVLISAVLGLMVLGAVLSIYFATGRMARSGDLSSGLAEASIAMETVYLDLVQAVARPDPDGSQVVIGNKQGAQFLSARFEPDETLSAELIVYRKVATAAGNFRLMRKKGASESPLPGTYAKIGFKGVDITGGPFVRVTLHVLARDTGSTEARKGSEEAVVTTFVRVATAEGLGNPMMDWSFLDRVKSVPLLKGELGF